jgi:hypothetical protein
MIEETIVNAMYEDMDLTPPQVQLAIDYIIEGLENYRETQVYR